MLVTLPKTVYEGQKIKTKKMANITLGGNPVNTIGELPAVGSQISGFELVATDLSSKTLEDFKGSRLILNIFPSVNTGVCSASVRQFNIEAVELENTKVLCISRDLPFAQEQFCAAEGIENVVMLSDYKKGAFGDAYGLTMTNGIFDALHSRCVIVADASGQVLYTEHVPEIGQEPNYKAALEVLYQEYGKGILLGKQAQKCWLCFQRSYISHQDRIKYQNTGLYCYYDYHSGILF
eukprot:TRINITY_DN44591_c0_g1_i1.p1 TRINITY_DN44591_c0_g1~~TRINITY_DN44591_c0_g1_i1.p1  ORF type:complete len:236 (+),score=11.75 TRINITY_DN44591_c0_g1_i1:40-747(+)